MNKKTAVIAVMLICLAAGAYVERRMHGDPRRAAASQERAATERADPAPVARVDDAPLARRLDALADEVAELRAQVAHLRSEAQHARERPAPEPELTPEQEEERWAEHMTLVEASFHEEVVDPRWASEASGVIERALAAWPALGAAARSTECRAQTCRMELELAAPGQLADEVSSLARALGDHLPTARYDYVDLPGGRQAQVLYLSRASADAASEQARADEP